MRLKSTFSSLFIAAPLITFLTAFLLSLSATAQNFNFVQFGLRDGLPQSQVVDLIQDDCGYLWVATQGGGIARFDGSQFKSYSTTEGLPSNFIKALAYQQNGDLWIGGRKGLSRLRENKISTIDLKKASEISALTFFNDSLLAIGTTNGMQLLNVEQEKIIPTRFPKASINDIQKLENGQLSVATDNGWWLIRSLSDFEQISVEDGLAENGIIGSLQKSKNSIWVISKSNGMTLHRINYPDQIVNRAKLPSANYHCAYAISNNNYWFGTQSNGCYLLQNGISTQIERRNGLPNNAINKIIKDNLGQIWLASAGGGLIKVLEQNFQFFNKNNGLPSNGIQAIAQDSSQDQIWLGLEEAGLAYIEDGQVIPYRQDKDFLNVPTTALCFDLQHRLWVGTSSKGIALLDSLGLYQIIDANRGLSANQITALATDENGNIWAGTREDGLNMIQTSFIDSLESISIISHQATEGQKITTVKKGSDGNIWFANKQGQLGRISRDQKLTLFDHRQGIPRSAINAIKFDDLGGLWLGMAGEGLVYAKNIIPRPQFNKHPFNPKLSSANIYLIEIDERGDLWVGNEKGVDRFSPAAAEKATVAFYGYSQGFKGGETNLNATLADQSGNLWIGTVGGLVRVQAGLRTIAPTPPILSFENIRIQNKIISPSDYAAFNLHKNGLKPGINLPWNIDKIAFQLQGVHLNYPHSIQYRWRLIGEEENWSSWSKSNRVSYANLTPGKYEFEAMATSDGLTVSETLRSSFRISSPIWKKGWFQWIIGLGMATLLSLIFYFRIQQIRKKESLKRRNLEMQNELLNLNQKALQLQMNPHFIFNTLNSINALVAKGSNTEARKQINNFAKQLRSTLSNSRKEFISLEEEMKSLSEYLVMLQFCHSTPFEFEINKTDRINPEELELPPMIIQPFVENAVLHGFSQLDRKGKLSISFDLQGQLLVCEIMDNGIGRKRAGLSKAQKPGAHQSAGMEVTKARLDNLKDKLNYKSLEIFDLKENDKALGTKVIVRIPSRVSY